MTQIMAGQHRRLNRAFCSDDSANKPDRWRVCDFNISFWLQQLQQLPGLQVDSGRRCFFVGLGYGQQYLDCGANAQLALNFKMAPVAIDDMFDER